MAEQTQPVQRRVALKVIKPGMDSKQVVARFEAERQALALMDHVNIARVLDAGTYLGVRGQESGVRTHGSELTPDSCSLTPDSGRPYFVMELVHGVPITQYCDDHRLTPRQRLELFVPVCHAVQHAHQKGVIHRDLKPSNILVTLYDGVAVPKVIDFGVAKATDQRLTERTLFTQFGTMVGTPEYMSPEQAETSALGVDTRSDIYALGVLLYELLTGSTPLGHQRFREAAYAEVLRIIKEEEPPRPSTRLSDSGKALASISAQRQMEPVKLTKLVRGELDWVVMKALEKDRTRRYATAQEFAADVQRYLTDEPVQACPPSAGYRLRKFVRRHKGPVTAGVALAALLVLGIVGTSVGLVRALRAEHTATQETARATAAEAQATEEVAIAKAVNDFLQNDLLAQAAPEKNARAKKVTVEELLGRAAARIPGKFGQRPRVEAEIRQTIGDAYHALGDYPTAQLHLERAWDIGRRVLGEEHPCTLTFMNQLAIVYQAQEQFAKAESLIVRVLDARRRLLGDEHPGTLVAMSNLAVLYKDQRQFAKAEPLFIETLEKSRRVQGDEHRDTLILMNNLALLYQEQGQFARAEPLFVETLGLRRRALGEEHPDTLHTMNDLAGLYQARGQFALAEPLFVQVLDKNRHVFGEEHPRTLAAMTTLAMLYVAQGQYPKAEELYVRELEISRRVWGEEHPDTLRSMNNLATLYGKRGQIAKAEPLVVEVLDVTRRVRGEDHPATLAAMSNLAASYWSTNQLDRSVPLFEEVLKRRRAQLGPDHPSTLRTMANLGVNYRDAGRLPEGLALLERAWELARKRPGALASTFIPTTLAETYDRTGQYAKAEPLYRAVLETARTHHGIASPPTADALDALGRHLLKQQKSADAEPPLRECLAIREQNVPDDWATFNTKSMLGGSLLGQRKYAEAEPLLLAGFEGMKQREERIPFPGRSRLAEAVERLVQLYDATGKPDRAAEWRQKLPATKSGPPAEAK
jgi:serine/threonine protein kinase/tetratricopeptide (TPR) repeat protein